MDNIKLVGPLELSNSNKDTIRKVKEAFLISKGKTLEPSGLKRYDKIKSIYFFHVSVLVKVSSSSISGN